MSAILLPIHHEYVEKIFSGEKIYEFRKQIPSCLVDCIWFYETKPMGKIVGEAKVTRTLTGRPGKLWEETNAKAGVSKEFYDKYFKGKKRAYAYELAEVKRYERPVALEEKGIYSVPQSYRVVRGLEEVV